MAGLRQHHAQHGLAFTPQVILVPMYADDVTLYVQHPAVNLDPLIREIIRFGGLSGITINWGKSTIFPLTPTTAKFQSEFPLKWTDSPVKYLGIWLSRDHDELWSCNYGKLMDWLESRLNRWRMLPLSLAGRLAIAKMVVLPKFLCLC